jgi:hypothetical protein
LENEARLLQTVFDNFAALHDEEIVQAIRQEYPSFAGKVSGRALPTGSSRRRSKDSFSKKDLRQR